MRITEWIVLLLEMAGTVVFAIAGGLVGIERGLDYFGIPVLSMTTAVGGGMLRDLILGQTPPAMFTNPRYVVAAILTSVVMLLLVQRYGNFVESGRIVSFMGLITFFDAVGLGLFTVVGMNTAIQAGFGGNGFLTVFVGVMTGVGGGVLRDIMVRRTPLILRREIYAVASILGAVAYFYLLPHLPQTVCMVVCAGLIIAVRLLSVRFHWNLPNTVHSGGRQNPPGTTIPPKT